MTSNPEETGPLYDVLSGVTRRRKIYPEPEPKPEPAPAPLRSVDGPPEYISINGARVDIKEIIINARVVRNSTTSSTTERAMAHTLIHVATALLKARAKPTPRKRSSRRA